ncbi:hypothetical protein Pfo_008263 [Paulownia fortunei]|nr:hypothetical protein Pfo_008263 [Paulownia fortunei]
MAHIKSHKCRLNNTQVEGIFHELHQSFTQWRLPLFSIFLFSLFVLSSFSNAKSPPKPQAFNFPIKKDDTTNQYYTSIQIGSNSTTFNVVIDLGGKFLWFNSIDYFSAASSYRPILCGTQQCRIANGVGCVFCFLSPPAPGCTNNTCSDYALNPYTGTLGYSGLGEDVLGVYSTRGDQYRQSFQEISKSLFTTPLIRNPVSTFGSEVIGNLTVEYFINVKSIKVGEKTLSFNKTLLSIDKNTGSGGTGIRTVRPYTGLHSSIYRVLINEFVKAAASKNIKEWHLWLLLGLASIQRPLSAPRQGLKCQLLIWFCKARMFMEVLWLKLNG